MTDVPQPGDFDARPPMPLGEYEQTVQRVTVGYDLVFAITGCFLRTLGGAHIAHPLRFVWGVKRRSLCAHGHGAPTGWWCGSALMLILPHGHVFDALRARFNTWLLAVMVDAWEFSRCSIRPFCAPRREGLKRARRTMPDQVAKGGWSMTAARLDACGASALVYEDSKTAVVRRGCLLPGWEW